MLRSGARNEKTKMIETIAGRLLRSAGAATLSQIWRMGVTFGAHMALRRFVPPDQWGVYTWSADFLFMILAQIRDLGVTGHMVRDKEKPWGNFLAIEIGWGAAFTLAVFLAAPLLAMVNADQHPDLVPAIQALCIFLFVHGLGMVPMIYFEAELAVDETVPAEIARNLLFAALSLTLAMLGYGVWSLIIAHIAGATLFAVMLWWRAWGRMRLRFAPGRTMRLVRLGLPLMAMALLEQLTLRVDALVLGIRFSTADLATAVSLAGFAVYMFRYLADPLGRALYPALMHYLDDPPRAFAAYRTATMALLTFAVPAGFFFLINAEGVVLVLGGVTWIGAVDYLRVASLTPLVRAFSFFGLELLLVRHQDRLLLVYTLANLLSLAGFGLLLTGSELGPIGMAVAGYLPLGNLLLAWAIYRLAPRGFRRLTADLLILYAVAAVLFLPLLLIPAEAHWWRFSISCVVGLLVVGYAVWRHGAEMRGFLLGKQDARDVEA